MISITAKSLLTVPEDRLRTYLKGKFVLVFDDGEKIETNHKETIFSWYFWEAFRKFPNIPISKIHHIQSHYNDGYFDSQSHIKLASAILDTILKHHKESDRVEILPIVTKALFDGLDKVFIDFMDNHVEDVHSIDILDFIELQHDHSILGAMEQVEKDPTYETVNHAYSVIDGVLKETIEKDGIKNNVVKTYVSKCSSNHQIKQCIGPRGFVSDIDFTIFNIPVTRSYTMGMGNIYNTAIESRSAAKALYLSIKALGDSEDFAKALQLACMSVKRIHYTDCGSDRYIDWYVRPKDSKQSSKDGDLKLMVGMWYLDTDTGELKQIKETDTHLYGKTIKIRNPIYCQHPDKYGICAKCFGELAYTIPKGSNIGHFSAVEMTTQISQSILSTKHLEGSKESIRVEVPKELSHIIQPGMRGKGFLLSIPQDAVEPKLEIPRKSIRITDIELISDLQNANVYRLSDVDLVTLYYKDKKGNDKMVLLPLSHQNTPSSFTLKFLEYIRKYGVEETKTSVIVDLSNWKDRTPFVIVHEKEFEFSKLESVIESLLKSKINKEMIRNNPEVLLSNLFDTVNMKISVHLSYLSTIVYALCVYDLDNDNYDMGRGSPNLKVASFPSVIEHRSMGAMMLFEGIHKHMTLPHNYYPENRPDHPLDVLMFPGDMVDE